MTTTAPVSTRSQLLPAPMSQMLQALMPDLRTLLPPDIPYEQFRAALWLELTSRPQLTECSVESIRDSAIKAATYGMLPGRDAHLLPFRNKRKGGRAEATYVPNYFGICLALERTGKVARTFAHPVYEGDEFSLDYFADAYHHVPYSVLKRAPGQVRFYYGAVKMKDGTIHVEVMTLDEIEAVRRRAPAHDEGPWVSDFPMMARKTALKRCAKYVRLTPQQEAMLQDDEEREREDIPAERHLNNIIDLYGEDRGQSTPTEPPPVHTVTGEVRDVLPDAPPTPPTPSMWRDTLMAHQDHPAVPPALRTRVKLALHPGSDIGESKGFELASAVLDVIDAARVEA